MGKLRPKEKLVPSPVDSLIRHISGGQDTRNWQAGPCPEGARQLLPEMGMQRADYGGQRRLLTQREWGACRRQGVPGRLPGRGGPELRLEIGLGEKGVSAGGRACSKSWRRDEPVPLQTVVCVCISSRRRVYMCVHVCMRASVRVCAHVCVS